LSRDIAFAKMITSY